MAVAAAVIIDVDDDDEDLDTFDVCIWHYREVLEADAQAFYFAFYAYAPLGSM